MKRQAGSSDRGRALARTGETGRRFQKDDQQCQIKQIKSQNSIKLWTWPTGGPHYPDQSTLLRGGKKMSPMCSKADS